MIKLTDADMHIISGESNGGYDWILQFCSLEGYECQWKKEQAEELKKQILESQQIVERLEKAVETKKQKVLAMYDRTSYPLIHTLDHEEGILKELKEILTIKEGN